MVVEALVAYLESLPTAWADATQEQRTSSRTSSTSMSGRTDPWWNTSARSQNWSRSSRHGRAQAQPSDGLKSETTPQMEGLSHLMAGATPMGIGHHTCHTCIVPQARRLPASSARLAA